MACPTCTALSGLLDSFALPIQGGAGRLVAAPLCPGLVFSKPFQGECPRLQFTRRGCRRLLSPAIQVSVVILFAMLFFVIKPLPAFSQEKKDSSQVSVKVVKYGGLAEEIRKNRGKVVVVDFWATFCTPCLKGFPHLIELNRKYSRYGLVAISVNMDNIREQPEIRKAVEKWLRFFKSDVTNLILDEDFSAAGEKMHFTTIPCIFVFNRQGQWKQFTEDRVQFDTIEKYVVRFLKAK